MVEGMLDEVMANAAERSTEPRPLDRAVVDALVERKRAAMADVFALLE
jgi:hypothetical protein